MKRMIRLGYVTGFIGFLTFHAASAQTAQTGNNKTDQMTTTTVMQRGFIRTQTRVEYPISEKQAKQIEKVQERLLKKKAKQDKKTAEVQERLLKRKAKQDKKAENLGKRF